MQDEHSRHFLVVVPLTLIAEDLAQVLRDAQPGARVLMATTASEAMNMLRDGVPISAAFIELRIEEAASSGLIARLRELGARIVLMRDDMPEGLGPCHLLDMPFSDAHVVQLLKTFG